MKLKKVIFVLSFALLFLFLNQTKETTAIYNGTISNGEYPWMVLLKKESDTYFDPPCGGVLIDSEWVLTAHHCWKSVRSGNKLGLFQSGEPIIAYIGGKTFNTGNEVLEVVGEPITYSSSEFYSWDDWPTVDLALWRLFKPSIHEPISIGSMAEIENLISSNSTFTSMGYGNTYNNQPSHSDYLYKFSLSNLANPPQPLDLFFTAYVGSNNSSTCGGDSGSPLVYSSSGNYFLAGLTHAGDPDTCGSVSKMYFQQVPKFDFWIYSTINPATYSNCINNSETNHSEDRLRLFDQTHCTGNVWSVNQTDQVFSIGNFSSYSMDIQPGYSVIVSDQQSPPSMSACYSGDLWNMNKDYYPGSHASIANNIATVKLINGSCSVGTPDAPASPDTQPLPPGAQTTNGVELYQYPNMEGELLYTFNEGFSNEPNDEGYSVYIPSGDSIRVYDDDNHQGSSKCFSGSVNNLQDTGWQTRIQSIETYSYNACETSPPTAPNQTIQTWDDINYTTNLSHFSVGFHNNRDPQIESIKIPPGMSAFFYQGNGREIKSICLNRNVSDLSKVDGWDNKIRSFEVFDVDYCQGTPHNYDVIVFDHDGFNGPNLVSNGFSAANNVLPPSLDQKISSIYVRPGKSVRIFENQFFDFNNGYKCFTSSQSTMQSIAFDNNNHIIAEGQDSNIRSFLVYDNNHCEASPDMIESSWGFSNDNGTLALGQFVTSLAENNNQSITIEWEPVTDPDADGIRIFEHLDDDVYELVATVSRNATAYTFNNLVCGEDSHYLVKSYNEWGDSAAGNIVAVSTPTCYVEPTPTWSGYVYLPTILNNYSSTTPQEGPYPNDPTDFTAVDISLQSMRLEWNDMSDIEDSYRLKITDLVTTIPETINLASDTNTYTMSNLYCGRRYYIELSAINIFNDVEYQSNVIIIQPVTTYCNQEGPEPFSPEDLELVANSVNDFTVGWLDMSNIEDNYQISYRTLGYPTWTRVTLPSSSEIYLFNDPDCSAEYEVYVTALNIENGVTYESSSDVLNIQANTCSSEWPTPYIPTNLTSSGETNNSAIISWSNNSAIVTSQRIDYTTIIGGHHEFVIVGSNVESYTLNGLWSDNWYTVTVTAINELSPSEIYEATSDELMVFIPFYP